MWTIQKSAREFSTIAQEGYSYGPNVAHVENSRSNIRRVELSKEDHKKFMKRLRERVGPVRFYMCGEYGKLLSRPHYHYILFGYDFPDKQFFKNSGAGTRLYRSKLLEETWTAGHAWIGDVDKATCDYVAGYVIDKLDGPKAMEKYLRYDEGGNEFWVQPEFGLMSRNPGIGATWFDKYHKDVTSTDRVFHHDREVRPPRYYDKRLEQRDPALHQKLKLAREEVAQQKEKDTERRLQDKETVAKARLKLKKHQL